ncbi:MAG: enoyl-CoA hydratase/isomerase family protein [Natronospirillum sp.]|uniref:enoyl-CoA hydratase-related protein n=1 Tax=Natronospirillum sp. TaxID=2812955 RepID=UPI0025EED0A3|nr:enoyl-CoA hydratase-related protein [Natronospirillum sp.]MCH8552387.1 enoyl-CoA hydratase/isomerase family protein [Natronospirillum sp.]
MTQSIEANLQQGVASIVFNRPERGNVYDEDVLCAFIVALDDFAQDDSVRVLHIRGKGDNFCLGADPDWMRRIGGSPRHESTLSASQISRMLETLMHFPVPTLAEVQGKAQAGALGILACCDYVIGTETSCYQMNEIHQAAMPVISTPYLIRVMGERTVRALMLTGAEIDAGQAQRLGLIQERVPESSLKACVDARIEHWLALSPVTLRQAKIILSHSTPENFDPERSDDLADLLAATRQSYYESK